MGSTGGGKGGSGLVIERRTIYFKGDVSEESKSGGVRVNESVMEGAWCESFCFCRIVVGMV